ncbi:MAG: hypothetical protein OEX07_14895 [Gammaproteobacteria bacterium]|nr:hypothetical protein [Gammaproteobacteria bacterium]
MDDKNKLYDLNNIMFEQLNRLNKDDLNGDDLKKEVERSQAITSLSKNIIDNAKVVLEGAKFSADYRGYKDANFPPMLGHEKK